MGRSCHYIKPNSGKTGFPTRFIFFDTETGQEKILDPMRGQEITYLPLKLGAAIYVNTDTLSGVPYEERFDFTTISEFWDWVMSKVTPGKVIWMFAHNLNFDLSVLEWHHQLYDVYDWGVHGRCILPDGAPIPFVVDWRPKDEIESKPKHKKGIRLIDSSNYFGLTSLAKLGEAVGVAKMCDVVDYVKEGPRWFGAQPDTEDWETLKTYCMRDVEVLKAVMFTFMEFVKVNKLGSFAISAAGQAMNAFKHRFMPEESILIHNNVNTMRLEREAYMGGRVELLQRQGRFDTEIRELDINSMYPYIMTKYPMPVKRIRGGVTPRQARREMPISKIIPTINAGFAVIAKVMLDIPMNAEPVAPIKHDGKLIYPTGCFEATLCTPELKKCVELGYVTDILDYALYETNANLFTEFIEYFYTLRDEYKKSGQESFANMAKLMMNSLYGKFGQYTYEWHKVDSDDLAQMAIVDIIGLIPGSLKTVRDAGAKRNVKYRNIGGKIEVRDNVKVEPRDGFCAIAAHIVAYGRQYLSELIELAGGRKNVIYCDTDSLHVVNNAHLRLIAAGVVDNKKLGMLKIEAHSSDVGTDGHPVPNEWGVYRGAKDYNLELKDEKLKGVRKGAERLGEGVYRQDMFRGFNGAVSNGDLNRMIVTKVVKRITGKYTKAYIDSETGAVTPWHMRNGEAMSHDHYYFEALAECVEDHTAVGG